jgi:hypothetical protein
LERLFVSPLLIAVVRNNIIPFLGRGADDKGHDGFGLAHVDDFVRHARFDVDEIAGLVLTRDCPITRRFPSGFSVYPPAPPHGVFQDLLEPESEFVAHFSFEDIKDQLEADMNMDVRDATRRYRGNVGRWFGRADIFGGHADIDVGARLP